jgi:hypothetical protein
MKRFEELLDAFELATLEWHSYLPTAPGLRHSEEEEAACIAARAALVEYVRERIERSGKTLHVHYDQQKQVYRDEDGCPVRDKFGQPL